MSWETPNGVYLIGGGGTELTSEIVYADGSVEEGFPLKYETDAACAIPDPCNNEIIITGGFPTAVRKIVSVYNEEGWQRDLAPLNEGRAIHACSDYKAGGKKVSNTILVLSSDRTTRLKNFQILIVIGGVTVYNGNPGIRIASTEIYDSTDNTWRVVGRLPATIWGMSATTLDNRVLLFGKKQLSS